MWEHRCNGHLEMASDIFADVAFDLEIGVNDSVQHQGQSLLECGLRLESTINFLLYKASIQRHQQKFSLAQQSLAEVRKFSEQQGYLKHYQLSFQSGLNYFARAQFNLALEDFQSALKVCKNHWEYAYAKLDEILCLMHLNYEFKDKLQDFTKWWKDHEHTAGHWQKGIAHQLLFINIDTSFKEGRFTEFQKLAKGADRYHQTSFMAHWLASLPYLRLDNIHLDQLRQTLELNVTKYEGAFRIRTLDLTSLHDDFITQHRITDQIERLYLWVWKWLADPSDDLLALVIPWASHVCAVVRYAQLSSDDLAMLKNSLRWIALFTRFNDQAIIRELASVFGRVPENNEVLKFESRLLDTFYTLRDQIKDRIADGVSTDEGTYFPNHHLMECQHFLLKDLYGHNPLPYQHPLAKLKTSIQSLRHQPFDYSVPGIYIDVLNRRLTIITPESEVRGVDSDAIITFLSLVSTQPTVSVLEVLFICYGIRRYDAELHDQKIAQLLYNVNRLLDPYLRAKRKRDIIIAEFDSKSQSDILFQRASRHAMQMLSYSSEIWQLTQVRSADSMEGQILKETFEQNAELEALVPGVWLKRQTLESVLKVSRATAGRRIAKWRELGLIEQQGVGPSSRYKLEPNLISKIKENQL
jgi:hypothetical protein